MAKGYKVKTDAYEYEYWEELTIDRNLPGGQVEHALDIDQKTGEVKREKRKVLVPVQIYLPMMICNPALGSVNGQPPKDFNLYELGAIGKKIEKTTTDHVILDKSEYGLLKKRVEEIQKSFAYKYFEMVRRVMEPEEVELEEKK